MQSLTNSELEATIVRAWSMSRAGDFAKSWREYDRAGSERVQGQTKLMEACMEAAKRGILRDIQRRRPDMVLPHYAPAGEIQTLLAAQRGWVANRGFKIDYDLAAALEQLLAFYKVLQRQELTGEDKERELATYETDRFDDGKPWPPEPREAFLSGLRRGFAMRGEEKQ